MNTSNIRDLFKSLLVNKQFTEINREKSMTDLVGNTTIEIVGASFISDEDAIFGEVNWGYVKREEEWYNSMSLSVNDIPGGAPAVWKAVADKDGFINSNYGWCIYSQENGFKFSESSFAWPFVLATTPLDPCIPYDRPGPSQYAAALEELKRNPESRRAIMIYTRPSMWLEFNKNGRSDFMCTNTVQYLIRGGRLNAIVNMRSQDSVFGHKNDRCWQVHVQTKLANDLGIEVGQLIWQTGSLHIYARHFYLVDHFAKTGQINISKKDYAELYPNSPYI
jgi:hypothetical protein